MAGTTGKVYSSTYKDNLRIENSNSGVDSTSRAIYDSIGNETSTKISTNVLNVQPKAADGSAFSVFTKSGTAKFSVDTSNNAVKSLGIHNNTNVKTFSVFDVSPGVAGTHYAMPIAGAVGNTDSGGAAWALTSFGTDIDPATSPSTITGSSLNLTPCIWWLDTAMTIDSARVIASADGSTTLNFHIIEYTIGSWSGVGGGDLSSGVVKAANSALTVGADRVTSTTLTVSSSAVSTGRAVLCFFENVGGTDDVTATVEVIYHYTG